MDCPPADLDVIIVAPHPSLEMPSALDPVTVQSTYCIYIGK